MTFPNNGTGAADGGQTGTTTDPATTQTSGSRQQTSTAQPPAPNAPVAGQQQDGGQQTAPPKPGPPANADKRFTQADVDAIIHKRMSGLEKSLGAKLATVFGGAPADGDGTVKPEDVLKRAEDILTSARNTANTATAEALATAAGIKPERIATFIGLANLSGVLKDVDQNDAAAVKSAIKAVVDAKAAEFPEWKVSTVAAASGPNLTPGTAGNAKPTYTRADLEKMSPAELASKADELAAAAAEGRIS
ncbi:hypothetical protein [Amycolatopsis sp. cmx-4-54]|uniref:hypothetical protein n=1 Tax=Amycolatopsis sp. cmx-4-54 TaxID=2790936 RepID=UPI00397A1ED1